VLLSALLAQETKKDKKVLTNADIVLMTQNHFDDETLIKIIQLSETDFDVSASALVDLKNQGVGPAVLRPCLSSLMLAASGISPYSKPRPHLNGGKQSKLPHRSNLTRRLLLPKSSHWIPISLSVPQAHHQKHRLLLPLLPLRAGLNIPPLRVRA
jgi:hypothetical protein